MPLRVCLAGQLTVEVDGVAVATDGVGPLGRVALAYLITERARPVPKDELAEVLWGEELPRTWETAVRVLISKVRALLGRAGLAPHQTLTTSGGCHQLHLPADAVVDLEVAAAEVAAAETALRAGQAVAAQAAATSALAVTARGFLPGGAGAWVERRQAEARALHLQALQALAAAGAACQDWPTAVRAAETAVELEPFQEQTWVRLMGSHAAAGNRAEALRCYQRCRRLLAEELGVDPSPATQAAYRRLLSEAGEPAPPPAETAAPPTSRAAPLGLPTPLTSFVGREDDVAEVVERLGSTRLLTLIGTGGVGKTRLALQAARVLEPTLRDGAALVELAPLADARLVDAQVLSGLGVGQQLGRTPTATLVGFLQGRDLLLILDNCEHLLGACAVLAEALLSRCPGLRILATSREPLRIPVEVTRPVRSLSVPVPAFPMTGGRHALLGFEAVRLFAERAEAASGLRLTEANAAAAARICAELDGIPLALELAAARTTSLSLDDIAARLDDRFALLASGSRTAPSRQRTLKGAVDWTYDALRADQRTAFQRLSVFAGDFTLAAAAGLWPGGTEEATVLDLVASLVDCSVLVAETGGQVTRFRLPETMRQYAVAKLDRAEADVVRGRHLAWYTAFARGADEALARGGDQAGWLDAVEAEQDNLRAALAWGTSAAAPAGAAVPLAAALGRFWEVRGHLTEGRRWLDAATAGGGGGPARRARALNWSGILAQRQGDTAAAETAFQESLVLRRGLGDRAGVAVALHGLGNLRALHGDAEAARAFFLECLAIGRELGAEQTVAASLANLGWVALNQGDLAAARAYDEESLALRRRQGDRHGIAMLLGNLGYLAYQEGRFPAARAYDEESLALRRELGDRHGIAMLLGNLGHLALQEGDDARARVLYHESLALRRQVGDRHGEAGSLANLADLARLAGDLAGAAHLLNQARALADELGDRYRSAALLVSSARVAMAAGELVTARHHLSAVLPDAVSPLPHTIVAEWLEAVAALAAAVGDRRPGRSAMAEPHRWAQDAATLLGAAQAVRTAIGAPVLPRNADSVAQAGDQARQALGAAGHQAAWLRGQTLGLPDALASGQGCLSALADAAPSVQAASAAAP